MDQLTEEEQVIITKKATQVRLETLFRTITANQKQALILKSEGKTTREIAAIQGISQPAVVKAIKKAQATAKVIWSN